MGKKAPSLTLSQLENASQVTVANEKTQFANHARRDRRRSGQKTSSSSVPPKEKTQRTGV